MEKFYALTITVADGMSDMVLKPKYFKTLEKAKEHLEEAVKDAEIIKRYSNLEDGVIEGVETEGDFPGFTEYYEITEEKFI